MTGREFLHTKKGAIHKDNPFHIWWAVQDLNLWPPPCKGGAQPTELTARNSVAQAAICPVIQHIASAILCATAEQPRSQCRGCQIISLILCCDYSYFIWLRYVAISFTCAGLRLCTVCCIRAAAPVALLRFLTLSMPAASESTGLPFIAAGLAE